MNEPKEVKLYLAAENAYHEAQEVMKKFFEPEVNRLIEEGLFLDAKEYLRDMPHCASKVLFFRSIIMKEEENLKQGL